MIAGGSRSRIEAVSAWLPTVLYLAAIGGYLVHSPYNRTDFPLDDAWIHRVYARALALGQGMAYNDGVQEAGATSPLWVLLTVPPHWFSWLGVPAVVIGVKAVGVLTGALAVEGLRRVVRLAGGGLAASTLAACVLAVEPRLAFSALAGMEPVLVAALWLGVAWAALARRTGVTFVLLGLAPLARPEAALLLPFGLAALALDSASSGRALPFRRYGLALIGPAAAWSIFCRLVNGHWLPTTFYVKTRAFQLGGDEIGLSVGALSQHGWAGSPACWLGAVFLLTWAAIDRRRQRFVPVLLLLAAPVCFLAAVVGSRSFRLDGYYWTRWTDPAALVLTAGCAAGLGLLVAVGLAEPFGSLPPAPASRRRRRTCRWIGVAGAVALVAAAANVPASYLERRARLASDSRAIHEINVAAGLWIREHTPPNAAVGVNDAGAIRFLGQRKTIDLVGLNAADVAFRRVDPHELVAGLDYLAVFPAWFRGSALLQAFEREAVFEVPLEEYTVCPCPGQTTAIIARRRHAP